MNTRRLPSGSGTEGREELEALRETVSDLHTRLNTLEEERDFYRKLLEAPEKAGPEPPVGQSPEVDG